MAKNVLPVDFQDDILAESMNGRRKYQMITNSDGTVSFVDVTEYTQVGSNFGQAQVNATNEAVNESADKNKIIDDKDDLVANSQAGMMAGALAVKAIREELNQNMVITGWYQPGANSISEAVSYAHNLLQNHQSINAIVRYSVGGSDNSLHIIGSKYSQTRGRYLVMNRTTDTVYSFRATGSGFEETEIQNIPTANHVDVTISGGDGSGSINISQYTGGYSAVIPVLINTTTGNWDINVGIQGNLLIAAGPGVAEGYQVIVRLYRFK